MNQKLKRILQVFLTLLLLFGASNIIARSHYGTEGHVEVFHSPISVSGADQFLINNDAIYVGNNANSSIQVFDAVGNFLYGLRLPSSGGSFWMCKPDARLFIYIVRTNQVLELLG